MREGRLMRFIGRLNFEKESKSIRSAGKLFQRLIACSGVKH